LARNVVAITGASSGIGAAFARRLAPTHDLILIARRRERLLALASEFSHAYGTNAEIVEADLAEEDDIVRVADRIGSESRLVLLVNNAGFGTRGRFWEAPIESQERMHRLHVMATVRLSHAALRILVQRSEGGIINVASVSAFVRVPGTVSYAATKTWMTTFTEGLYLELKGIRSNVTVQALCPGYTHSEFHDALGVEREKLGGSPLWLTAEEVVDASLEGLSRRKLFVIPGWRYRLLTTFLSKIPSALRVHVEALGGRMRSRQFDLAAQQNKTKELPS
jgi:short-subunit dehydrogenase